MTLSVNEKTRQRVLATAEEFNYTKHKRARNNQVQRVAVRSMVFSTQELDDLLHGNSDGESNEQRNNLRDYRRFPFTKTILGRPDFPRDVTGIIAIGNSSDSPSSSIAVNY